MRADSEEGAWGGDEGADGEARAVLLEIAGGTFGKVPAVLLVDEVLGVTRGDGWPTREAAMQALLRRRWSAVRDGLVVVATPRSSLLGRYAVARRGRAKPWRRPYVTELWGAPLRGSCSCPDFTRSALGWCKHLLCVLEHCAQTTRGIERLLELREPSQRSGSDGLVLSWDPRVPLGRGDRLRGIRLFPVETPLVKRSLATRAQRTAEILRLQAGIAAGTFVAEAAVVAILGEELAWEKRRDAGARDWSKVRKELRSLMRALYPYQAEGVERAIRTRRLLLADDMGLGKTTQAIAVAHALVRGGVVKRGLVVVPASLRSQWGREWRATTDVPLVSIEGTPAERAANYRKQADQRAGFCVISYDQLRRDVFAIRGARFEMVILDEAQRIKNWSTKSAAAVAALDPEHRLVLTGTPMENRLEELASLLDWVDDRALAPKWRLSASYTSVPTGGDDEGGAMNLKALRERLAPSILRRVRSDVLSELPPRTDTTIPVEMTVAQRVEHDELIRPIRAIMGRAEQRPLSPPEFLRLMSLLTQQRILSNGIGQARFESIWPAYKGVPFAISLFEELFAPKLRELRRLVTEIAVGERRKIVVFSQWRRMLRLAAWTITDILERSGLRSAFFTGAESHAQRTRNLVEFHDDPAASVLFLSDAGGVGLNLQKAANACINLELPWNPAVLEQRVGRIHRLGQTRPIDVFHLVSSYGIEARIAAIVSDKRALFQELFDGISDSVQFSAKRSFMREIERLLPERAPVDHHGVGAPP